MLTLSMTMLMARARVILFYKIVTEAHDCLWEIAPAQPEAEVARGEIKHAARDDHHAFGVKHSLTKQFDRFLSKPFDKRNGACVWFAPAE